MNNRIFVIYGHDLSALDDVYRFLGALGYSPITWNNAKSLAGRTSVNNHEVVEAGLKHANAVIILITPDEWAEPREKRACYTSEATRRCQARPNVLFEAGWAFGSARNKVIIVESGARIGASDLDGVNTVRMDNGFDSLNELRSMLELATGHSADTANGTWGTPANYPNLVRAMKGADRLSSPTCPQNARYAGLSDNELVLTLMDLLPRPGFHLFTSLDRQTGAPAGTWKRAGAEAARRQSRLEKVTENGMSLGNWRSTNSA
ncbi:MAG: TIR domain-containing protein [Myxococcota bacterium]